MIQASRWGLKQSSRSNLLVMLLAVILGPSSQAEIILNPLKHGFVKNYQIACLKRTDHNPNKQKAICRCEALAMYDAFTWNELVLMADTVEQGKNLSQFKQQRIAQVVTGCQSTHRRKPPE